MPIIDCWISIAEEDRKHRDIENARRKQINERNLTNYEKELEAYRNLHWWEKRGKYPPLRPFTWDCNIFPNMFLPPLSKTATYEGFLDWQLKRLDNKTLLGNTTSMATAFGPKNIKGKTPMPSKGASKSKDEDAMDTAVDAVASSKQVAPEKKFYRPSSKKK